MEARLATRVDYGFDLDSHGALLHDRRRDLKLVLQDRCYEGGYLGSSDPSMVCAEPERAMLWDAVHPTSAMHC